MAKRLNSSRFIEKARKVHNDKYDYSLVEYKNNKTKVKIICPDHGIFEQTPNGHLNNRRCKQCSIEKQTNNTDTFINKAKSVHDDKYDYSLVEYVNCKTKVKIICPDHGIFEQLPSGHLKGSGCKQCYIDSSSDDTDTFINKAKQIHDDKYDYSLVKYVNSHTKIKIICPDHGIFEQLPYSHLVNGGCANCGGVGKSNTKTFIEKAMSIHGDEYDYSLVKYVKAHTKVKIICPDHGIFEQTPNGHLKGYKCINCANEISTSKGELELREYISSIYKDEIITNDRSVIPPYEIDIYLPDIGIAFEYNGNYWHQEGINKPIGYHQMKTDMCNIKDIKLYHIWESVWMGDNLIKEKIKDWL